VETPVLYPRGDHGPGTLERYLDVLDIAIPIVEFCSRGHKRHLRGAGQLAPINLYFSQRGLASGSLVNGSSEPGAPRHRQHKTDHRVGIRESELPWS
jgi:hypothetical protein